MPFMEQSAGFNAMNFLIPMYDLNGDDMPQNTTVYSMQVKGFLCPSDVRDAILIESESPCNYASNTGNGLPGGFSLPASYGNPNGPFYLNSATTMANLIDGSSNTAIVRREHHRLELEHRPVAERTESPGDHGADGRRVSAPSPIPSSTSR